MLNSVRACLRLVVSSFPSWAMFVKEENELSDEFASKLLVVCRSSPERADSAHYDVNGNS